MILHTYKRWEKYKWYIIYIFLTIVKNKAGFIENKIAKNFFPTMERYGAQDPNGTQGWSPGKRFGRTKTARDEVGDLQSVLKQKALQMRFVARNNKSDLQDHSSSLAIVPFHRPYMISC